MGDQLIEVLRELRQLRRELTGQEGSHLTPLPDGAMVLCPSPVLAKFLREVDRPRRHGRRRSGRGGVR